MLFMDVVVLFTYCGLRKKC